MITIEQLLESVDLDFEPRWVTKNLDGTVCIWKEEPMWQDDYWLTSSGVGRKYTGLKLAEFTNKDWVDCIYEVPRKDKPVVKIEKLQPTVRGFDEKPSMPTVTDFLNKINEIIDWINDNHKDSK